MKHDIGAPIIFIPVCVEFISSFTSFPSLTGTACDFCLTEEQEEEEKGTFKVV
jgi:hypothetical protein